MYTALASPTHLLPVQRQMPTIKDPLSGGAVQLRRRMTRGLMRWEFTVPGRQGDLDQLGGFLDYVQGDTPFWFDGAGFGEILEPIIFGIGTGSKTQFALPHRYVISASLVVYHNDILNTGWSVIGGDVTCDAIQFTVAPGLHDQLSAKYRRKIKVVLETEDEMSQTRSYRNTNDPRQSVQRLRYFLQEVPF
jgi:hypothetical protein